jgi:hypothetical protein
MQPMGPYTAEAADYVSMMMEGRGAVEATTTTREAMLVPPEMLIEPQVFLVPEPEPEEA